MKESHIIKHLSKKYNLTERETKLYYEIYWKKFVLKSMNDLEYDAIEILNLGVFVPKYKTIRYLLFKYFWLRRSLKTKNLDENFNRSKLERVEIYLRKLTRLMFLIKKSNKKRYIKLK